MSYGITSYNDFGNNIRNISQDMVGGRVFVKYIDQAYSSGGTVHDHPIAGVSDTAALKIYTLDPGPHTISTVLTGGSTATVRLTTVSSSKPRPSRLLVFTTKTNEPDYGISSLSDAGERLVSGLYPCPQFVQKITFNPTPAAEYPRGTGWVITEHLSNTTLQNSGQLKTIFYTIPENTNDCWYYFDSGVTTSSGTNTNLLVLRPTGAAYNLPEAFVFALDNLTNSTETYGIKIFNSSGGLTFDSGNYYANIKGYETLIYSDAGTSISSSAFTGSVPAFLIPQYGKLVITGSSPSFIYAEYTGCVKRIGNTLYTQNKLTGTSTEEAGPTGTFEYGITSNLCLAIDAGILGGVADQPLAASIVKNSGSTSCTYNVDNASNCTTTENFTISVSGGNANPMTYTWSLVGATGFSIGGSTTSATCGITNSSSVGTYTGTLRCIVQQSGSTSVTASYSLSHAHTLVPLSASLAVSSQQATCSYSSGNCTTQETHTVTTSGGDGTTKTYSWTFVNNPGGFSFNATNAASAIVSVTAAAGTYTCRTRCTITQGATSVQVEQDISHTHTQQGYTITNPLGFNGNTYTYVPGGGAGTMFLDVKRDATWVVRNSAGGTEASGDWATPTGSTVGDNYWVNIVRNSTTNAPGNSTSTFTNTTGWVQITTTRTVSTQVTTSDAANRTGSAQWTVNISATSAGSVLGTGTIRLAVTANAS